MRGQFKLPLPPLWLFHIMVSLRSQVIPGFPLRKFCSRVLAKHPFLASCVYSVLNILYRLTA